MRIRLPIEYLFLLLPLLLAFGPIWPSTTIYKSVHDGEDGFEGDTIESVGYLSSDHQVRDGKLYLNCFRRTSGTFLITYAADTEWRENSIAEFRRENPHLEEHWPNPARVDGGIEWLKE